MSYSPTTWETGDTITAEKLNKMEGGIAGAAAIVNFNITWERDSELGVNRLILYASFDEVLAAYQTGSLVTAAARFEDADYSEYSFCRFYLCGVDDYNSTVTFYGHDPTSGGYDPIGFYVDASGETMSTDGGYVPST